MTVSSAGTGRYFFAVARALDPSRLEGAVGLSGAPLQVVEHRDLQAVVCSVDLDEFGEASLASNLEDLGWLEQVARSHNDVVFAVASTGTVAPMRLVTICADDDSVRGRMEALYDELSGALDRVQGRKEWSVKVYAPRSTATADDLPEKPAGPGAGAAYLQRKRAAADRRRSTGERSVRVAEEIHGELAAVAVAGRQLPSQDPRLTGRADEMILNGAYLVPDEEGEAFRELVQRVGESQPGTVLEVAGPWPPYSFSTLDAQ